MNALIASYSLLAIEGDKSSTHLLNAVSPGWTCSIPFARYTVDRIEKAIS